MKLQKKISTDIFFLSCLKVNLFCCNFLWSLESSYIPIPIQVLLAITDICVEPSALWRLSVGGLILEAIFSIRSAVGFEHTTQKLRPRSAPSLIRLAYPNCNRATSDFACMLPIFWISHLSVLIMDV